MEKHEIERNIGVGDRKIRELQVQALETLARDLQLNGRVLTYADLDTLKEIQVAGIIMKKRIERFYDHFDSNDEVVVPVIDEKGEEDKFI